MASFTERMIGAARLDVNTYEEVEADTTATTQAMVAVLLSSLAAGIGALGVLGITGLVKTAVISLVGWVIWAGLTFLIGTKILPEPQTRADMGELLRTLGFAASPGILRVAGIVPFIGWIISIAAVLWMLVAMVIAVRQALDYKSTLRAVGVCAIGFVVYLAIMFVIGGAGLMGGLAMS